MVIREKIKDAVSKLRLYGNDNPIFEAHQIVRFVTKMNATDLVINHLTELTAEQEQMIDGFLERRKIGEPLQYILGTQEFMSLEFKVSPDVLIPRADTETLVELVLEKTKNTGISLLDIGTGTGCIPLSVAHYNKNAFVRGIDISPAALKIAMQNAENLHLNERADFDRLDILTEIPKGRYDIVTSNPPYIKSDDIAGLQTDVSCFEPHLALDGGDDGLKFYRRICDIAPEILNTGGLLVFEIGFDQGNSVPEIMKKNFSNISVLKDLCGNDRVAFGYIKK